MCLSVGVPAVSGLQPFVSGDVTNVSSMDGPVGTSRGLYCAVAFSVIVGAFFFDAFGFLAGFEGSRRGSGVVVT